MSNFLSRGDVGAKEKNPAIFAMSKKFYNYAKFRNCANFRNPTVASVQSRPQEEEKKKKQCL